MLALFLHGNCRNLLLCHADAPRLAASRKFWANGQLKTPLQRVALILFEYFTTFAYMQSTDLPHILEYYEPITLGEMSSIRLMNRIDIKFVTTMRRLQQLLEMAAAQYRVQVANGTAMAQYYTRYFDTASHDMYFAHHNRRANRQKLRIRSYLYSAQHFLEVKTKNNHGRTHKKRIALTRFDTDGTFDLCHEADAAFLAEHLRYAPSQMHECIENRFKRITLVNKMLTERLTIDTSLQFRNLGTDSRCDLNDLAIIELKRDGLTHSPILGMLNQLRIHPLGFSKYCMGTVLTDPGIKHNMFKPRLTALARITR